MKETLVEMMAGALTPADRMARMLLVHEIEAFLFHEAKG